MRWVSIDAAKFVSGYALWDDDALLAAGTVEVLPKERGSTMRWGVTNTLDDEPVITKFETWRAAWQSLLPVDFVVMEAAFVGSNRKTSMSLAESQGKILAFLGWDEAKASKLRRPNPSEWRKACTKAWGVQWPKHREGLKAKAQEVVYDNWFVDAGTDAADAILIGFWHVTDDPKQRGAGRRK